LLHRKWNIAETEGKHSSQLPLVAHPPSFLSYMYKNVEGNRSERYDSEEREIIGIKT
jgi:hypothetical protein